MIPSNIFCFCNQKGGVGKTTSAINLATGIAQKGFEVLLIDLDPQANATSGVGEDKNADAPGIYHVIVEEISPVVLPWFEEHGVELSIKTGSIAKEGAYDYAQRTYGWNSGI